MENKTRSARRSFGKKAASLSITAALALTVFAGTGAMTTVSVNAADEDYGLAENIQDGVILHCFDWKYKDITDELENIAKAGFTSIQTSPVQPAAGTGPWYWLYQPLSFTIAEKGDLGTADELKELCEKAESYGIKVVVDVVANHLAGDHTNIQSDLVDDKFWHDYGKITSYRDRFQVTHGDLDMPDLNSENEYVQTVVKNYVNELKEIGVDGIRWDAAKHIGLPSEGCDFWKVVTDTGIYNYGEILNAPYDGGGDEEMREYAGYMSLTDSGYSSALADAFKNGTAPGITGNWTDEGVAANKLVYLGESHDTYSNKEGAGTNNYSQNVIDRAYAVAAAKGEATALYLSRPFAKARDSIRVGVKGSTHFSSPEVAAVNHFHNAMIGKEEATYASDNCTVVTRKDGGAVIVKGKGSGAVSVENKDGAVPAGTYYDEVTGAEFTVTEKTITGTVGESGIAVVYNSQFLGSVSADKENDTAFVDSMKVTLHAAAANDAYYKITVDGDNKDYGSGSFNDGDVITVGEGIKEESTVYLTLSCTRKNGTEATAVYRYFKNAGRLYPELEAGGVVFDNSIAKWDTINVYIYDESGATTITNGTWPGVKMTDVGENYYTYLLPEQFETCHHIFVIFNNGKGDQIPGAMQTGMSLEYTEKKLYDGTKWGFLPENEKKEEESSVEESSEEESSVVESSVEESSVEESSEIESSVEESSAVESSYVIDPSGEASEPDPQPSSTTSTVTPGGDNVKTSDNTSVVWFVVIIACSAAAAAIVVFSRKKSEE